MISATPSAALVRGGVGHEVWRAVDFALGMTWEILWALVLGFLLTAVVQALVPKRRVERLLPDASARSLATATALGIASSSCSYAAVALARALFRKGASFAASIVLEVAATNLVVELGIVMAVVLGWQFTLGEFAGGPIMIVALALLFRALLTRRLVGEARAQAERGRLGSMEGHASMDMSIAGGGSFARRLLSVRGLTATSHVYVMEWAAVLRDVVLGLAIAGCIAAWVSDSFWRTLFLTRHGAVARVWGPLIGPLVAVASFVCSIGNVPLAGVLWNGGISFGGVMAFVFGDLIILPVLDIYRRYYGLRTAGFLLATLYAAMVTAGLIVGYAFAWLGLVPHGRHATIDSAGAAFTWGATTYLDLAAIAISVVLVWRFVATGGLPMLGMMDEPMEAADGHGGHGEGHGHGHAGAGAA